MTQTRPVRVLNNALPMPAMRSLTLGAAPTRFGADWAREYSSGWYAPLRPEQIQHRLPWLYGMPYGMPLASDPYMPLLMANRRLRHAMTGLGQQTAQGQQLPPPSGAAAAGSVIAGTAAGISLIKHGQPVAGAGAIMMGLTPIPVIGIFAGIAGAVTELLAAAGLTGAGCGQTCIQASQYADQAGALMAQNLNTYLALPAPRAASLQSHALAIFDQLWQGLEQACGNPALGDAGKRCISDRQAGACKWTASQGGWQPDGTYKPWGPAGSGSACWNWFIGMRDPISQDPHVVPDAQSSQAAQLSAGAGGGAAVGGAATDTNTALLLGGALLLFVIMSGGNKKGSK